MMGSPSMFSRRDVVKAMAAGFAVLQLPAAEPNAPLFFSKDQFALLDCLTEILIPADGHSPGAHEAGVAPFIDKMAAEAITAEEKDSWRKGLSAVEEFSNAKVRAPFLKASKKQQTDLLTELSNESAKNEDSPDAAVHFFSQLKQTTAFLYYSSSIGIHKEMDYKGNVLLNQFVGYDVS